MSSGSLGSAARLAVPLVVSLCLAGATPAANGQSIEGRRYVNPLTIEGAGNLADPTVIRFEGRYYLYATGGLGPGTSIWSSDDLVKWEHHVARFEGHETSDAPAAFVYNGHVYVAGNGTGLFRSAHALGPFEYMGDFSDHAGRRPEGLCPGCEDGGFFDPTFFVDDDERLYLYYAGPGVEGIYGAELDPADPTQLLGPVQLFFAFDPDHLWERYGNRNEYSTQSWVEGPWMTKHDGTYHLQYSAPGTDWITYAVGVYTSASPLGPFTYYDGSPVLLHRGGMINGVGHNSIVDGPDGTLWTFYNILYNNWDREELTRRIGMDPVGFDAAGNMVIDGPSETPQWAPGVNARPWVGNASGSVAVSSDKALSASSARAGREAPLAVDDNIRTVWEPAAADPAPRLDLDLGVESRGQQFIIDSVRLLFALPEGPSSKGGALRSRGYRIEVSEDGATFTTVVDKSANAYDNAVEFDVLKPVRCRYVRLTLTGWPEGLPRKLIEITVFGRPDPR
jgi:hypothetical protein